MENINITKKEASEKLQQLKLEMEKYQSILDSPEIGYDSIKNVLDAIDYLKIDSTEFYEKIKNLDSDTRAYEQLKLLYKAINQIIGFKADWKDKNQEKWYPYFDLSVSGGVVLDGCCYDRWCSTVGSRLCTKNENVAKYIGKQFADLYADWMLE